MTWVSVALIFLLAALSLWLGWRLALQRRRLAAYARQLRAALDAEGLAGELPLDVPGIEDVSNAVAALAAALRARLSLRAEESARLAAVLEQMADGVLIADSEGRVRFANPAAERMFGRGEPLGGRTVAETLRQHQMIAAWQACRQSGGVQSQSVEIPGRRQFIQLVVMPDSYGGGTLLFAQDLTRVRRLETVRQDFVSNVSHELRTPLASLKALAETLQDGALEDPPAARRFLSRMLTEVDALTQMAAELLELARIESGQVALQRVPARPAALLRSSAERMGLQAERAGLAIRVDCPDDLPAVDVDVARLEQVFVNLIHNAVKFTRPGGTISLQAERAPGGMVRFAVADTGIGISPDDLPRVFERFYKADRARSGGGTGLGLSIARHLVESHGGRIWVESVEGRGSTFYFTIPAT